MPQHEMLTFQLGVASCGSEYKTEPSTHTPFRLHMSSVYNESQCAIDQANVASFEFWLYCSFEQYICQSLSYTKGSLG